MLALPPDYSGVAMAAARALIRLGVSDLHIVACPSSGLQTDMLIGAGCVATVEAAAITLGEYGAAPRFVRAVGAGAIALKDSTCPAIHAGLQAAEKGVPFMPLRGIIGSDLVAHRPEWRIIDNPLAEDEDPILLLPAIAPDVALFHAPLGDRFGNVWVGRRRELITMAHASRHTLVTVEKIYDGDLLGDERMAAGTLSALYVSATALAPRGAWPLALAGHYPIDGGHMEEYMRRAASDEGFAAYLADHVMTARAA
ncbi:MAG: CoA synthetase [Proteobacteria bacterium]|nr:CoA synthetase [Pseudomonadota bacterium]